MFFTIEVFLDIILLLINQRGHADILKLVTRFLEIYDLEFKNDIHMGGEGEYIRFYVNVIKELMIPGLDESDIERCLLKFKMGAFVRSHPEVYEILEGIMVQTKPLSEDKQGYLRKRVHEYILTYECTCNVKKMFGKLNQAQSTTDDFKRTTYLDEVNNLCKQTATNFTPANANIHETHNRIDFRDKRSLARGIAQHRANKVDNVLKMGLQGLNGMFGERGGIARGEAVLFCALGYNYKSTMLLNVAKWTLLYNDPVQVPGGGIPTVLFISLENEAAENMMYIYRSTYENITNTSVIGKSDDEIIEFIHSYFTERGWNLIIERRLGSDFGYDELVALYEEYTRMGYHIQMSIIDYLSMMKKNSPLNNRQGNHLDIKDLYTKTANYFKNKDCTFVTAHQLNRTASDLAKSGVCHVVKKYHMGLLADSVDPYREMDVVIFLQLETNSYGNTYLTAYIDKHRYVNNTPDRVKFMAYRFGPAGIPDDINCKSQVIRDLSTDNYEPTPLQEEGTEGPRPSDDPLGAETNEAVAVF